MFLAPGARICILPGLPLFIVVIITYYFIYIITLCLYHTGFDIYYACLNTLSVMHALKLCTNKKVLYNKLNLWSFWQSSAFLGGKSGAHGACMPCLNNIVRGMYPMVISIQISCILSSQSWEVNRMMMCIFCCITPEFHDCNVASLSLRDIHLNHLTSSHLSPISCISAITVLCQEIFGLPGFRLPVRFEQRANVWIGSWDILTTRTAPPASGPCTPAPSGYYPNAIFDPVFSLTLQREGERRDCPFKY